MRELGTTRQQVQNYQRELGALKGEHQRNAEVINRMRQAFNPDERGNPRQTAQAHYEAQLDEYMQAAIEAERNGRPMPLTANLAAQFFQSQIAAEAEREKLNTEMAELKKRLGQVADPSEMINHQAYAQLDTFVQNALTTVFGQGDEYNAQKAYQFKAVGHQLADEIKGLQTKEPHVWDEIRRDPAKLKRMCNYFVERNIPPRARQIMEQERIQREPQTLEGLMEAFREAQEVYKDDPRQLAQVLPKIRSEILATKMEGMRGARGQGQQSARMYK